MFKVGDRVSVVNNRAGCVSFIGCTGIITGKGMMMLQVELTSGVYPFYPDELSPDTPFQRAVRDYIKGELGNGYV